MSAKQRLVLSLVKVIWACSSPPIGRSNQLPVFAPNDHFISFSTSKTSSTLVSWVFVEAWWLGWVERSSPFSVNILALSDVRGLRQDVRLRARIVQAARTVKYCTTSQQRAQCITVHSAWASCAQPATTLRAHSWSSFYSQPPTLFVRSSFSFVTLCCLFICATCVFWLQDKLWKKNLPRSFEGPTKFDQFSANLKLLALPPNTNPNSTAFALKCETSILHYLHRKWRMLQSRGFRTYGSGA